MTADITVADIAVADIITAIGMKVIEVMGVVTE
jgi:hypothetical protein